MKLRALRTAIYIAVAPIIAASAIAVKDASVVAADAEGSAADQAADREGLRPVRHLHRHSGRSSKALARAAEAIWLQLGAGHHSAAHVEERGQQGQQLRREDAGDRTVLILIMVTVFVFYLCVWRSFYLAEHRPVKEVDVTIVEPPRQPGQISKAKRAHGPQKLAGMEASCPAMSMLQLEPESPLACPIWPMLDPHWSVDIVGVSGKALLLARLRKAEKAVEIIDRKTGHIVSVIDDGLNICGLGGKTPFGRLEKREQNNGLPRFLLHEQNFERPRAAMDVGPSGNHMSMILLYGSMHSFATVQRRQGKSGARRGEYLEIAIQPGADAVLVVTCALGILAFVPPPEPGSRSFQAQRDLENQEKLAKAMSVTDRPPGMGGGPPVPPGARLANRAKQQLPFPNSNAPLAPVGQV